MQKKKMNLSNNLLFAIVMSDENICRQFLENLLSIKISKLEVLNAEDTFIIDPEQKGSRLDIYVLDDTGRAFNIELQNAKSNVSDYLAKRARYYHSIISVDSLPKGEDYDRLGESYVIFVCTFDEFGKGLPRYTFEEMRCSEDNEILLQTGSKVVILNTKAADKEQSPEIRGFCRYVDDSTEEVVNRNSTSFLNDVHAKVEGVKEKRWRELMTVQELMDRNRADGIAEGKEIGREEGTLKAKTEIANAMKEEGLPLEQISRLTGLTEEEITAL